MAEHLNQPAPAQLMPFNFMGKPISEAVRQLGYEDCKKMGLDSDQAMGAVSAVAEQLERDKPYEAQKAAMQYLDLTGAYRLMSVLLVGAATEDARQAQEPTDEQSQWITLAEENTPKEPLQTNA